MPVVIRELIIRAVVSDPAESSGAGDGPRAGPGGPEPAVRPAEPPPEASRPDPRAMVEECVQQVLAVLRRSRDR